MIEQFTDGVWKRHEELIEVLKGLVNEVKALKDDVASIKEGERKSRLAMDERRQGKAGEKEEWKKTMDIWMANMRETVVMLREKEEASQICEECMRDKTRWKQDRSRKDERAQGDDESKRQERLVGKEIEEQKVDRADSSPARHVEREERREAEGDGSKAESRTEGEGRERESKTRATTKKEEKRESRE